MMRRFVLAALFIVVFAASLLIHLPADWAWARLGAELPASAYGVRGTLWQGTADVVVVHGQRLERLRWQARPAALATGALEYTLDASIGDGRARGRLRAGLDGRLGIEMLRLEAAAEPLVHAAAAQPLPVGIGGRIDAYAQDLLLDATGRPERGQGLINWSGGSIILGEAYPLGDYAVRFQAREGWLQLELFAVDAVLRIEGQATLDLASGLLSGEVLLQTLEGASLELIEGIRFIGLPDPAAENRIRFDGNIADPMGFRARLQ